MTSVQPRSFNLSDRYLLEDGEIYLSGLQALVRIPLDQRRLDSAQGRATGTLISGYEGSPLAGYDLEIMRNLELLDAAGVVFRPSVNEELAANAIQGSQLASSSPDRTVDGVVGIWYGKAPGLDRATDAVRHGNLTGADSNGGVLALVGDDSVAKSSSVPSSSEVAMAEIGMPILVPADPQDVLDLGLHGIALSRFCGLWTGMKLATNVVDGAALAKVRPGRVVPVIPNRDVNGKKYTHEVSAHYIQPKLGELESTLVSERVELALRYARANALNTVSGDESARVGIVAAGTTFLDVKQALKILGIDDDNFASCGVRILRLGMISPLEPSIVEEFTQGLDEIIVVEEKRPLIEGAIKSLLYGRPDTPRISGRRTPDGAPMMRSFSDLPPELIAENIAVRILAHLEIDSVRAWLNKKNAQSRRILLPIVDLPSRTPYFCSGCPHNRSTETPEGSLVGAGIGCSALAAFMPSSRVGDIIGFTQMGGEGASWIGMSPFVKQHHLIQNIGDGTFHHSGSLAVRASVASGVNVTYKILYNGAVAMTGGQDSIGQMTVPELASSLIAEGVARVVVTSDEPKKYRRSDLPRAVQVRHRDDLVDVQNVLADIAGVTVIIHDQECATELRRKRKRKLVAEPTMRVLINERVCEGCGDCGVKSNCLSVQPVETEYGRKTQIHQASCNKDFSCLDGDCPSFLTVIPDEDRSRIAAAQSSERDVIGGGELPAPVLKIRSDDVNLRITGIGGTGIVTTAQVIATAATLSGLYVRSLDQMGMAQKGGAVVSDIRLSPLEFTGANKVGTGDCDLYLGCDLLVAATEANLAVTAKDRTIAVISTSQVPTGEMVTDTTVGFPDVDDTAARILDRVRRSHSVTVDARKTTLALLDDDQFANIYMIGVAVQAGALPIEPKVLEEALTMNGVAVEKNIQAFRWGRCQVADPARIDRAVAHTVDISEPKSPEAHAIAKTVAITDNNELAELVVHRVDELIKFQNQRYATVYAEAVESVRKREEDALGHAGTIADSYARNLFKLMAYKDEYEVARLCLDPAIQRSIESEFGPNARYRYRLHPPFLRALGMNKKISLGAQAVRPAFHVLHALRRVRGTKLDLFGRGLVRTTERQLIDEYRSTMERAMTTLSPGNASEVDRLANLPDMIRGYEEVKMRNVEEYRSLLAATLESVESQR